ncbi:NADPH:quinone oxidoreductase family protein [Roseicitreum antarcticum]|uniref:NADPH2:quinone reductase n=1 Tax=Roseicitreum antarcticum TaxID=564137 RepID=A0A1H2UAG1_9RHOB|nr:NADPH:quinone oxidoreductase family protein [Roseicitreum antarcticum]SDW52967.1 NADPH2:quinone reductase [Roseicitreum antarcticum]
MRAYQLTALHTPQLLSGLALPAPGPGEVRVKIGACGLNFADLLMIKGQYQERPALPVTLGLELAGVVEACGPTVTAPAVGTRVAVYAGRGGLAEYGVFRADQCLPIPDAMPMSHAAAFQVAYGTSHMALCHRAALQPGETLLVLGAAGGVGLTAVEIGAKLGARVIAVARGPQKLAAATAAGAEIALDSDGCDIKAACKDLGGVDVIYDSVGDPMASAALRALRPEGRFLAIGFAGGAVPQFPANILLVKNISVIGFYWGGYLSFRPAALHASLSELITWYSAGDLRPHVSHILPLEETAQGLEILRSRASTGKVVIAPDPAL